MYTGLFEGLFDEMTNSEDNSFAIGCPDEQELILIEFMKYINKQDGWIAEMNDAGILNIQRLILPKE